MLPFTKLTEAYLSHAEVYTHPIGIIEMLMLPIKPSPVLIEGSINKIVVSSECKDLVVIDNSATISYCVFIKSKHRSIRVWKKLIKHVSRSKKHTLIVKPISYKIDDVLHIHPVIYSQLQLKLSKISTTFFDKEIHKLIFDTPSAMC